MLLSKIAESEPQSAYSAFVGDFKRKLSYFTPTIPSLEPLKDVIYFNLIPAITDGNVCSVTTVSFYLFLLLWDLVD